MNAGFLLVREIVERGEQKIQAMERLLNALVEQRTAISAELMAMMPRVMRGVLCSVIHRAMRKNCVCSDTGAG